MGAVIQKIPEQFGALVILVDHDMGLVSACCETTAVLDFGKLIASGPTAEVLRNEHVIRAYLGTEEDAVSDGNGAAGLHLEELCVDRRRASDRDRRLARDPAGTGDDAPRRERRRQVDDGARRRRAAEQERRPRAARRSRSDAHAARAGARGRRRDRPRGTAAAAGADGRGQPARRDLFAQQRAREGGHRLRARALPGAREALEPARAAALGRRAADGRARPGARLPAEGRPRRRAVARPRAGRRQAARADAGVGRRERRRRAPDRAVRARRARARAERVRDRGRPHPLRGHRRSG